MKGEYSKSESIDITYFSCGVKMLFDRYHLVEARNKIEVVVKRKAEIPFRLGQISNKGPSGESLLRKIRISSHLLVDRDHDR